MNRSVFTCTQTLECENISLVFSEEAAAQEESTAVNISCHAGVSPKQQQQQQQQQHTYTRARARGRGGGGGGHVPSRRTSKKRQN